MTIEVTNIKPKKIWSNMDAYGLINGFGIWDNQYKSLSYVRKPNESALELRNKIYNRHANPVGITKQGLINGISTELGLIPYNVESNTIFQLTYEPIPSGDQNIPDIFVFYKTENTDWIELKQIWSDGYENAKQLKNGFIVWNKEFFSLDDTTKNFNYSNVLEVLSDIPNGAQLKISYYIKIYDIDNNIVVKRFTDINNFNDINDQRFTYKKPIDFDINTQIIAYSLNDIPSGIYDHYYNPEPTNNLKEIKSYIESKYPHKWGSITDRSCIWDVHKFYGSGEIPSKFDIKSPYNYSIKNDNNYLTGGIEFSSDALFIDDVVEKKYTVTIDNITHSIYKWHPKIRTGRFYINGVPHWLFANPKKTQITIGINGYDISSSGIKPHAHMILTASGYNISGTWTEPYLTNAFEDYNYEIGLNSNNFYTNICRKRSSLVTLNGNDFSYNYNTGIIKCATSGKYDLIYEGSPDVNYVVLDTIDLNPINYSGSQIEESYFLTIGYN